jgi:DNA-binding winged helix-turn-helix (wHTH) protein
MRDEAGNHESYRFGPFILDSAKHTLMNEGVEVPLGVKPMKVLLALVKSAGNIITKDDLMKVLWPDTQVEPNNLDQQIGLLRRALGEDSKDAKYIVNVPRVGYRFGTEVEVVRKATGSPFETPYVTTFGDSVAVSIPDEPKITDRSGAIVRAGDVVMMDTVDEVGRRFPSPSRVVRAARNSNELLVLDGADYVIGILKADADGRIFVEVDTMADPDTMLRLDNIDSSRHVSKPPVVDGHGRPLIVCGRPALVPIFVTSKAKPKNRNKKVSGLCQVPHRTPYPWFT